MRAAPIWASEKPWRLARRSSSGVSMGAVRTCSPTSLSSTIWSRNHGSIAVAACTSSIEAPGAQQRLDLLETAVVRDADRLEQGLAVQARGLADPAEPGVLLLQRAQGLLQRLGEVAADGHGLAHALHVRGELVVGRRELLEREPRGLDHDVVQGRLEAGRRALPVGAGGDVVRDLVEGVADGQARGDLGDREAGGLRGQSRGARDPGVHLDHDHPPVARVDRELDVAAAGVARRRRG